MVVNSDFYRRSSRLANSSREVKGQILGKGPSMTTSETVRRFGTIFVAVFGTIGTAIGIAAFGWTCAVAYYGLRADLAHIGSSAVYQPGNVTEQQWRAMNDTLLMSLGALSENVMDTERSADEMSSDLSATYISCMSALNASELAFIVERDGQKYFYLTKYPLKWVNQRTGLIEAPRLKTTATKPS
jgi:hypothetical protein